jgi:hypothetical protein
MVMAPDLLDSALRVALVEHKIRIEDRDECRDAGYRYDYGDIYGDTIHTVKALCLGIIDPGDYLHSQAIAS